MELSAVILAGGRGTRLYPLTETLPKPLCPVAGITPLTRAVQAAAKAGAGEVIVTACHLPEKIISALEPFGDSVRKVTEEKPLGTCGAVVHASPVGETVLVLSGDIVHTFDLRALYARFCASGARTGIVTASAVCPTEYGVVCGTNGIVTGFLEKPSWHEVLSDRINAGIYFVRREVLAEIPAGTACDFSADLFPRLLASGSPPAMLTGDGYWCDIGNPRAFYACNMHFSGGENVISPDARVAPNAFVTASVLLPGVQVGENSLLDGCVVCENTVIGKNCVVQRGCVLGAGTVVRDNAVFAKDTLVAGGVTIGRNARIQKNVGGNPVKTALFDCDEGIGGVYGDSYSPVDAIWTGQALTAIEEDNDHRMKVGVMAAATGEESALLADALLCGVRFGGGEGILLPRGHAASCAEAVRKNKLDAGVQVSVNPDGSVLVRLFEADGLPFSRPKERKMENAWFRRDFPRRFPVAYQRFTEDDYGEALTVRAQELKGAEIAFLRKSAANRTAAEGFSAAGALCTFPEKDGCDRWDISADGTRLTAVSRGGKAVDWWHLLCLVGEGRAKKEDPVVLPHGCPEAVQRWFHQRGRSTLIRREGDEAARTRASKIPSLQDGAFLLAEVLRGLRKSGRTLDAALNTLPSFYVSDEMIPCEEEEKARKTRILAGETGNGLRFSSAGGAVTVIPSYGAAFRVMAEAVTAEAARELCDEARKMLDKL